MHADYHFYPARFLQAQPPYVHLAMIVDFSWLKAKDELIITKSLNHIKAHLNDYIFWQYSIPKTNKTLMICCEAIYMPKVPKLLQQIISDKHHPSTFHNIKQWILTNESTHDFWYNPYTHWMFWKDDNMEFEPKLKQILLYDRH